MRTSLKLTVVVAILCLDALATPITGRLNITGVGVGTDNNAVQVGLTYIDFAPYNDPLGSGTGMFSVSAASTGYFAADSGKTATVTDLRNQPGNPNYAPAGPGVFTPFALFTFGAGTAHPGMTFYVNNVPLGDSTFPGSPFVFTALNGGSDTSVAFSLNGFVVDPGNSNPGYVTRFGGSITSVFAGQSIAGILGAISGSPGFVQTGWTGDFFVDTVPIPEPATFSTLLLGGLLLAGGLIRRKRNF